MDIHTKPGGKIVVTEESAKSGYKSHQETVRDYLIIGQEYTVKKIYIENWHTDVYIEEVPGVPFNSVNFKNV